MGKIESLLDNPAWEALVSEQAFFAEGSTSAKRYKPAVLPCIACNGGAEGSLHELDAFIERDASFYIIGDLPVLPAGWQIVTELPCAQMLLPQGGGAATDSDDTNTSIVTLSELDQREMYELINQVQPGYYLPNTCQLGSYFGIRKNGRLVAMAGERMRLTGFSELSAICTLPGYTGLGYAQLLMQHLCHMHAVAGIVSFLHVALSNHRAIRLYRHMAFEQRREIVFRKIHKQ